MSAAGLTVLPSSNEEVLSILLVYISGTLAGGMFLFLYLDKTNKQTKLDIHLCFFSLFFYLGK